MPVLVAKFSSHSKVIKTAHYKTTYMSSIKNTLETGGSWYSTWFEFSDLTHIQLFKTESYWVQMYGLTSIPGLLYVNSVKYIKQKISRVKVAKLWRRN
jgi:hypothetical protein